MTKTKPVTRREFAAFVGAGTLGLSAQGPGVSDAEVRELLDGQAGRSIFDDEDWLELLRRALELNAESRARLRQYELESDAEPTITFVRY